MAQHIVFMCKHALSGPSLWHLLSSKAEVRNSQPGCFLTCTAYGRFHGADGQATEFQLKADWAFPLQQEPEDWDVNPATEDLPLEEVLQEAAAVRAEHLRGVYAFIGSCKLVAALLQCWASPYEQRLRICALQCDVSCSVLPSYSMPKPCRLTSLSYLKMGARIHPCICHHMTFQM